MLSRSKFEKIQQLCQENPAAQEVFDLMLEESQIQLSMVSHEIRNPVTLINSFLQLVASLHPEVEHFPYWEEAMENMQFLRHLLSELSTYNNSCRLKKRMVNLYALLHSFAENVTPSLKKQNISIKLEKESAIPSFPVDADKLLQIFMNLIRNAAEAMNDIGGSITISISANAEEAIIRVTDDGPGIPLAYQADIFDFFITHNKKEGTGLGLAIARSTAEAHGGSISLSSAEGFGTQFTIRLPILF